MLHWLYRTLERKYSNQIGAIAKTPRNLGVRATLDADIARLNNPVNFTIIKAQGGHVVEFRHYDPKTDRHSGGLYIITDQENFSEELGRLVMMECLSR